MSDKPKADHPLLGKLTIVRHGESTWNATGQWTGKTNVYLTPKGRHEAELMGEKLRDVHFDHAYVSEQVRTTETFLHIMYTAAPEEAVKFDVAPGFNERDYGEYTGLNKWQVKKDLGDEVFNGVRRQWNFPVPGGETLKMVYERAVPYYIENVLPRLTRGENVLIVAHGNSIRALMKYIESISDDDIAHVEMIFGTALIYQVGAMGRLINKEVRRIETELPPA